MAHNLHRMTAQLATRVSPLPGEGRQNQEQEENGDIRSGSKSPKNTPSFGLRRLSQRNGEVSDIGALRLVSNFPETILILF